MFLHRASWHFPNIVWSTYLFYETSIMTTVVKKQGQRGLSNLPEALQEGTLTGYHRNKSRAVAICSWWVEFQKNARDLYLTKVYYFCYIRYLLLGESKDLIVTNDSIVTVKSMSWQWGDKMELRLQIKPWSRQGFQNYELGLTKVTEVSRRHEVCAYLSTGPVAGCIWGCPL